MGKRLIAYSEYEHMKREYQRVQNELEALKLIRDREITWQRIETVPKNMVEFIGFGLEGVSIVHQFGGMFVDRDGYLIRHLSHWMPLPAPPVGP